jgi:alpha-mannosidase
MAHPVTGPAVQRAERVLKQRIRPNVLGSVSAGTAVPFTVEATAQLVDPVPYADAVRLPLQPFTVGSRWGSPWHTTWFRLTATVPIGWAGRDVRAVIDLGFHGRSDGFQAEGLAYLGGRPLQAVQPDRRTVVLPRSPAPGETVELWVEAASNPVMSDEMWDRSYKPTRMGDRSTAGTEPIYTFRQAELALHHADVAHLALETHALIDLAIDLPADDPQRDRIFAAMERVIARLDLDDVPGSAAAARAAIAPVFAVGAAPGSHRLVAVGHAHLDTAWLWPTREARRKATRTFVNAVGMLERFPQHRYAHSQAQHYAWVREDQPEVFARVGQLVAEGRWETVGGMWVEADLNLSGGESLVRQLVVGQREFTGWFGAPCTGAFLPDDFGYPAQIPQIARQGGCEWFFTQKLSWNETNRFPHHTFWWEGLDGSRLFTHFSPVETYNAINIPSQLRFASRNFADHGGASSSLVCFGHGDGGGGPTEEMVRRVELARDLHAVPPTRFGTVGEFFTDAVAEYGADAPVWVGEMYFEKHRGTYTSQLGTKRGNRRSERLLHEAELWSASAGSWPAADFDALWKAVLTEQFHDILPGSSIAWVHQDSEAVHADVARRCEELIGRALGAAVASPALRVLNPGPFAVAGVVDLEGVPSWVEVPALGSAEARVGADPPDEVDDVVVEGSTMTNGVVSITWDDTGTLVSLRHLASGREVFPAGRRGNVLTLRRDIPAEYDAWDIDGADANGVGAPLTTAASIEVIDGPLRSTVVVRRSTPRSTITQTFGLTAGSARVDCTVSADWHEDETRLQMELPVDVFAREARCGTQFGHVMRPRHANTTWDDAKFEVCAHRYVHVGEPDFGVAVLADGPHGYDVRGDALRLTLLRSSRYPDPTADRGLQTVSYGIWVHDGEPFTAGLEREGHRDEHPVRIATGAAAIHPIVAVDGDGVVIGAVKRADDGSGDLIVRLWESRGARVTATLQLRGDEAARGSGASRCDLLERPVEHLSLADGWVSVTLAPFQITTVRVAG